MNTADTYSHNQAFPYCHSYSQSSFLIFALSIRYHNQREMEGRVAYFSISRFFIRNADRLRQVSGVTDGDFSI